MSNLNWTDGHTLKQVAKEYAALVKARDTFEAACKAKCNAQAFSYRQGKVGVGCAEMPKVGGKLAKAIGGMDAETKALLRSLLG